MSKRGDIRRRDQERFRYLAAHYVAVDFEYDTHSGEKITALIIEMPRFALVGADLRKTIDAARMPAPVVESSRPSTTEKE